METQEQKPDYTPNASGLSMKFVEAVAYAADAHAGQVRKGTAIPYIEHPLGVASLVIKFGGSEDQAIAALLHDVVEDCDPVYGEKIQEVFGSRVASIVAQLTDGVKDENGAKPDWRARKVKHLAALRDASPDVLLVMACDKIHNARSLRSELPLRGLNAYAKFRGGIDGTFWYLKSCADLAGGTPAGVVLSSLVYEIGQITSALLSQEADTAEPATIQ